MKILVTGAAGLLGGEVCARLLTAGHELTGLVHRNPVVSANDGTPVEMKTLPGDVSQPRFGWNEARFHEVARSHDLVVHCAATVRFDMAEEDYFAVNVDGVANTLELAEGGNMGFLHVSTAYVCGQRNGIIQEDEPLPSSGFANGYEASKAAGERLVRASTLRWVIARPSIVVGEYDTGAIRQFDTTYAAFKLIATGRVRQLPARQDATLDLVPIDHVASGIALLAERFQDAAGGTFHLISSQPLPLARFAKAIGSVPHFHEPELVEPKHFEPARLPALERRLYRHIAGLYASYFQRHPHFCDREFRALAGRGCPPTGETYVLRLIKHCMRVGFLPQD